MLIKNTLQIIVYEKLSYLYGVMVSHTFNRTAVRQVNCELSWLNYLFCFNFHNVTFSREIQGYHTAEEGGGVSLASWKCISFEFHNASFNSLVTAEGEGLVEFWLICW